MCHTKICLLFHYKKFIKSKSSIKTYKFFTVIFCLAHILCIKVTRQWEVHKLYSKECVLCRHLLRSLIYFLFQNTTYEQGKAYTFQIEYIRIYIFHCNMQLCIILTDIINISSLLTADRFQRPLSHIKSMLITRNLSLFTILYLPLSLPDRSMNSTSLRDTKARIVHFATRRVVITNSKLH